MFTGPSHLLLPNRADFGPENGLRVERYFVPLTFFCTADSPISLGNSGTGRSAIDFVEKSYFLFEVTAGLFAATDKREAFSFANHLNSIRAEKSSPFIFPYLQVC